MTVRSAARGPVPRRPLIVGGAITSAAGFKAKLAAYKMRVYGFRHLKIKVGIDGQDDVARLAIVRRRLGRRADLRIDANEAWPARDAGPCGSGLGDTPHRPGSTGSPPSAHRSGRSARS